MTKKSLNTCQPLLVRYEYFLLDFSAFPLKIVMIITIFLQKIKVNVILADRESRKLIFSVKPKEKEESIQRKRNLMVKFLDKSFSNLVKLKNK